MTKSIIFDILAIDSASPTFSKVGMAAGTMSTKVQSAGAMASKGFLVAGVAAGALAIKSIKMAGDFDSAIVRLETTAGESHKALGMVSNGLLDMAGKVGYSSQELATAMYTVESAGYHGADGLKVMTAASKGARVEGADLTTTVDAVSSLLVDYHLKADQSARVTNILTAAVGHGKTTFEGLAAALPNVAAAGASAKITMAELASAIATMTMHGTDASKAGTYLRQVIGQLEAPSAKARTVMKGLGIDANQLGLTLSSGSGHGLADAIKMVDDAITSHLTPSGLVAVNAFRDSKHATSDYQKVLADLPPTMTTSFGALTQMVGGVKSLQGFLQLGGENLKTYKGNVAAVREQVKAGGHDVAGFAQQQQTLNGKLNDAQGSMSALAVKIGHDLTPAATAVLNVFTDFTNVLGRHHDAAAHVVVALAAIAGGLMVMKVATATAAGATALLGGEEGILALKMTVAAAATGDLAGATAGAGLAMGAMSSTIRMAAGAAGMGALIVASNTSNQTLGALGKTAGGALMGFSVGGPWGAAIGAGAGLIYGLATATGKAATQMVDAAAKTRHWTVALQGLTDARSAEARSEAANTLGNVEKGMTGTAAAAQALGIKTRDLVSYITNEGDARKRVNAIVAEGLKAPFGSTQQRNAALTQLLTDSLGGEGRNLAKVIQANKDHQAAVERWSQALKGVPKDVQTQLKLGNYDQTAKQVADLRDKYHLMPKQVSTILAALGYQATAGQLDALIARIGNIPRNVTVRVNYVQQSVGRVPIFKGQAAHPAGPSGSAPKAGGRYAGGGGDSMAAPVPVASFTHTAHTLGATFANGIADGIQGGKSTVAKAIDKITAFISSQADKVKALVSARDGIVQSFVGMGSSVFSQDFASQGDSSVGALLAFQQKQLDRALQVQADVAKVVSMGLSKALVSELANSGSTGIASLHALALGPQSAISSMNSLDAQTTTALSGAGMIAGNSMYGDQITSAQKDLNTATEIRKQLEAWRKEQDKNTVVELRIGANVIRATLLELKRANGKPLGLG